MRILEGATLNPIGNIIEDFVTAIGTHNFDDGFCKWNTSNPLYLSQCSFTCSGDPSDPNSKTTPLLNRTAPYYRGYTFGNAATSPLTFVVRIAGNKQLFFFFENIYFCLQDNLDAVRTRLTPIQNNDTLMQFFLRVYQDANLRVVLVQNQNGTAR